MSFSCQQNWTVNHEAFLLFFRQFHDGPFRPELIKFSPLFGRINRQQKAMAVSRFYKLPYCPLSMVHRLLLFAKKNLAQHKKNSFKNNRGPQSWLSIQMFAFPNSRFHLVSWRPCWSTQSRATRRTATTTTITSTRATSCRPYTTSSARPSPW